MVVDTLTSANEGRGLLNAIKKLTNKPIKYVANTHYHLDHALGNCIFAKEGAIIIAHENVRGSSKRAAKTIKNPESYGMTKEDMKGTVFIEPDICFAKRIYVDLGGIVVELFYPGASHNNSSVAAYIKKDNVLFTGDMLFNKCHPFIGEGDLASWEKVLDRISKINASVIIPGHGPLANKKDIEDMKEYIRKFDMLARKLCKGKTLKDSSLVANEMLKQLPDQKRDQLKMLVEMNLKFRYLKPEKNQ
jgi:glyoxylase-like metal-dependent hydrolase (beta-lactamase superfamily II)